MGIVGYIEEYGVAREVQVSQGQEDEEIIPQDLNITVLYGKLCQAILRATE